MGGVRQEEWQAFYTRKLQGYSLGEDYSFVDRIVNHPRYKRSKLVDYDQALYHAYRENAVHYGFLNKDGTVSKRPVKPLSVVDGRWIELETSPTKRMDVLSLDSKDLSNKYNSFEKKIRKCRDALLSQAQSLGPSQLEK